MIEPVQLIADCGSTKCDWLVDAADSQVEVLETTGFSPFFHTSAEIEHILRSELLPQLGENPVTAVWFYGTGVHDDYRGGIVGEALQTIFPKAAVSVEHDLLAAARAACGHSAGIACILGTGSNSCLYDGQRIVDNVPSLGWLLGDEGSGTYLGRALLRAWFYRELPPELAEAFTAAFPESPNRIKDRVYAKGGNAYVAGFSGFLGDHTSHAYVQAMLWQAFDAFLDAHVAKYAGHRDLPIHFVGSIAYHYQKELAACLRQRGLHLGAVIQKPIRALQTYHHSLQENTKP